MATANQLDAQTDQKVVPIHAGIVVNERNGTFYTEDTSAHEKEIARVTSVDPMVIEWHRRNVED